MDSRHKVSAAPSAESALLFHLFQCRSRDIRIAQFDLNGIGLLLRTADAHSARHAFDRRFTDIVRHRADPGSPCSGRHKIKTQPAAIDFAPLSRDKAPQ